MDNIGYIDGYSWRCLLGPMSKNIEVNDNFAKWMVNGTTHVVLLKRLSIDIGKFVPFNFYYFAPEDVELLKTKYKIQRSKNISICLEIEKVIELSGKKYKHIRNSLNKIEKLNLKILDNYKDFNDVCILVDKWSETSGEKYFRNFSGKSKYFYKNNWHIGCINVFCYDGDDLIACGSLSPVIDGKSIYIIGKSLITYPGSSEFLDFTLYRKAVEMGCKLVNMGKCSNNGLFKYKSKFKGSFENLSYDGKVLNAI